MKILNEIYGYSVGAAMGKFKHPRKGVKIDRTTEDVLLLNHQRSWNIIRIYA